MPSTRLARDRHRTVRQDAIANYRNNPLKKYSPTAGFPRGYGRVSLQDSDRILPTFS
ncbi:hypothetical protein [Baaleninema simplex]|uniref:hypothetical protein n=1 Tax=Baaleninema simplex TaxID=2862350 RepID=UPI00034AF0B5|nr:hypothetical protein [Baaleninema simplex]